MTEQIRESISAFMDGEASELELERLLKQSADPELRQRMQRYGLSGQLAQPSGQSLPLDISASVMAAIDAEQAPERITPVARSKRFALPDFLKPVASVAVAASVFATVLVGGQLYGLVGESDNPAAVQIADAVSPVGMVNTLGGATVNANYGAPALKSANSRPQVEYNQLARKQLQRYLLPHTDEATLNTPQGMMPYARIATLQVED